MRTQILRPERELNVQSGGGTSPCIVSAEP